MNYILTAYTKKNRIIGSEGKIPWNLPSERNRFKAICNGKKVIMGKKSFLEIGHALPYCTIVIISRTDFIPPEGCLSGKLFIKEDRMHVALSDGTVLEDELLIAGGGEIYHQALPYTDIIYATEIEAEFNGDTTFPPLDSSWKKIEEQQITTDKIPYTYVTYKKRRFKT